MKTAGVFVLLGCFIAQSSGNDFSGINTVYYPHDATKLDVVFDPLPGVLKYMGYVLELGVSYESVNPFFNISGLEPGRKYTFVLTPFTIQATFGSAKLYKFESLEKSEIVETTTENIQVEFTSTAATKEEATAVEYAEPTPTDDTQLKTTATITTQAPTNTSIANTVPTTSIITSSAPSISPTTTTDESASPSSTSEKPNSTPVKPLVISTTATEISTSTAPPTTTASTTINPSSSTKQSSTISSSHSETAISNVHYIYHSNDATKVDIVFEPSSKISTYVGYILEIELPLKSTEAVFYLTGLSPNTKYTLVMTPILVSGEFGTSTVHTFSTPAASFPIDSIDRPTLSTAAYFTFGRTTTTNGEEKPNTTTSTTTSVPNTTSSTTTSVPNTTSSTTTSVPNTTSSTTTSVPNTTSSTTTSVPNTTSSPTTSVSKTTSSTTTSVPNTTSSTTSSVPNAASSTTTSVPNTTSSTTTSVPNTKSSTTTSVPNTTSSAATSVPNTTSSTTTSVSNTTSSTTTSVPNTTSPTTTSMPNTKSSTTTDPLTELSNLEGTELVINEALDNFTVSISSVNESAVDVSWTAIADADAYMVELGEIDRVAGYSSEIIEMTSDTRAVIPNLRPRTKYFVIISAFVGNNMYSTNETITTEGMGLIFQRSWGFFGENPRAANGKVMLSKPNDFLSTRTIEVHFPCVVESLLVWGGILDTGKSMPKEGIYYIEQNTKWMLSKQEFGFHIELGKCNFKANEVSVTDLILPQFDSIKEYSLEKELPVKVDAWGNGGVLYLNLLELVESGKYNREDVSKLAIVLDGSDECPEFTLQNCWGLTHVNTARTLLPRSKKYFIQNSQQWWMYRNIGLQFRYNRTTCPNPKGITAIVSLGGQISTRIQDVFKSRTYSGERVCG